MRLYTHPNSFYSNSVKNFLHPAPVSTTTVHFYRHASWQDSAFDVREDASRRNFHCAISTPSTIAKIWSLHMTTVRRITMRALAFLLAWLPLLGFAKWDVDEIAAIRSSTVILRNTNGVVVAKIPVAHAQTLVEIKRRLVEASGLYFSIVVVEGTSPNAFVSNGLGRNVVAVNLGMLNVYGNDADVLAAVVGHEIGHIGKRHLDEKATREVILDIVGLIVGISLDYGINKHTGVSVPIGQVISAIGGTMISRKFDRDQEHEADELAVRWMHTAGYDTTGAIRLMQNLSSSSPDFFATHPTSEDRVANVRRHVAALVPRSTIVARAPSRAELPRTGLDGGAIAELRARADDPNDPIALGLEAYAQGRHAEAFRYAGLAAEKQDPRGQLALGYCYLLGIGISKDAPEAARWFKLAAAQQSATALTMLGIMYANGQGTPVDLDAATRYFQQAADANYPPAIARLAAVKLQGPAKSRDLNGGISLAIRAAEYNDPLGLYLLGLSLVNGAGFPLTTKRE
jgi:Zn-dependent protease with chaperone function